MPDKYSIMFWNSRVSKWAKRLVSCNLCFRFCLWLNVARQPWRNDAHTFEIISVVACYVLNHICKFIELNCLVKVHVAQLLPAIIRDGIFCKNYTYTKPLKIIMIITAGRKKSNYLGEEFYFKQSNFLWC